MKKTLFGLCCLALAVILAGCDSEADLLKKIVPPHAEPTLIIAPGTRLDIGDRIVEVSGADYCGAEAGGGNDCIRLDKPQVWVLFSDQIREIWTVKHDGDKTLLVRPNGFQVRSAAK